MSAADQLDDDDDTSSLIRSCLDAATSTVVLTAQEFRCVADGLLDLLRRYAMSDGVLQIALVPLDRIEVQDAPSVLQSLVNATHISREWCFATEVRAMCGPDDGLVVLLLAYPGLRWGELGAIRARRVAPGARRIEIAEAMSDVKAGRSSARPRSRISPCAT